MPHGWGECAQHSTSSTVALLLLAAVCAPRQQRTTTPECDAHCGSSTPVLPALHSTPHCTPPPLLGSVYYFNCCASFVARCRQCSAEKSRRTNDTAKRGNTESKKKKEARVNEQRRSGPADDTRCNTQSLQISLHLTAATRTTASAVVPSRCRCASQSKAR